MLVRPTGTAPRSRRRRRNGASLVAGGMPARTGEAARVTMPTWSKLSFTENGSPASGDEVHPAGGADPRHGPGRSRSPEHVQEGDGALAARVRDPRERVRDGPLRGQRAGSKASRVLMTSTDALSGIDVASAGPAGHDDAAPGRWGRVVPALGRISASSDPALGHGVPVRLVEDDLAQVPELVGLRRPRRMLVVELEQRALAVADLEEAHDLAQVVGVLAVGLAALDRRRRSAR